MTNIVSGAVSTVAELGKDEAWLQEWLKEQPNRLGLGDLQVGEASTEDAFVATDDDRCFTVDVQLGELEASRGFQVLDNWARNRVMHPDKTHVAVLVTEVMSDRYQTTLETLAEHLPLVVVELAAWKGQDEAILVPHIALSSDEVDLTETPAAKAAETVAKVDDANEATTDTRTDDTPEADAEDSGEAEVVSEAEAVAAEAEAQAEADAAAAPDSDGESGEDRDDTGVGNPWGFKDNGTESTGLLTKVGK